MSTPIFDVRVDRSVCMGNGTCTYHAPNTFDLDDDGKVVLLDTRDSAEQIALAAEACPTHAITFVTERSPTQQDPTP